MNHIISECSKLAQKEYKTRHNWVGKVIPWKFCKKLNFDHTNKWCMQNPASVQENSSGIFEIQMDHLISARRLDLIIINKKRTSRIVDFADYRIKLKESEKKDKYLNLVRDDDTNCNWCSWYSHQRISAGIKGLGNKRTIGDHPNYSIVEIGQNTEKSPRDLRFSVTQIPVRNHQLRLVWKFPKWVKLWW